MRYVGTADFRPVGATGLLYECPVCYALCHEAHQVDHLLSHPEVEFEFGGGK